MSERSRLLLTPCARLLLLVFLAVAPAFGLISYSTWEDRSRAEAGAQRQTRQPLALLAKPIQYKKFLAEVARLVAG